MSLLEVKNLQVRVDEREILHGLSLTVNPGEVHAIMGPNGSGKSTLSHVIAGKPGYEVTGGEILFKGENLLEMSPDQRSAKGVFLAFQYPVEIPGVATMTFLKAALNAQRKARGEDELTTPDFIKCVNAGNLQRILECEEYAGGGPLVRPHLEDVLPVEEDLAVEDS